MQQLETPIKHQVLVDDRERNRAVIAALEENGAEVEIERLRVGDYRIDNCLLVERKTIRDLALSVMSGRLFRQARQLVKPSIIRTCIIIEGRFDESQTGGLSRSGLHGTLISLGLVFGLPVLRSISPTETASIMLLASDQVRRHNAALPRHFGRKAITGPRTQMLMLQEIRQVGPERSLALLDAFGTIAGLAAAPPDRIAEIDGIGEDMAKRIWTTFHDDKGVS